MKTEETEAPKPPKKPRKDRGTRRVALPAWLVKDLEAWAKLDSLSLEALLGLWAREAGRGRREGAITLPQSVLARLAPAAEGSGRSISELLAEMEEDLCGLLDGRLARKVAGVPGVDQEPVPSLEDRLVEAFRARIRAAQTPEVPPADVAELAEAIKAGLERA